MKTNLGKIVAIGWLCMTATAQALQPEVLYGFQLGPGHPYASLIQGSDANFYGTTSEGGSSGRGTIFKVTTNGGLTMLVSFSSTVENGSGNSTNADGANPFAGLVFGIDGNLYGTTSEGGSSGHGTVFQVTTNGVLTSLVSFAGVNGAWPHAGLVLGGDGNFYGTTGSGGIGGAGTVFRVTTNGALTTLVSFTGADGAYPKAGLAMGGDGNFYGTTGSGGSSDFGTVFKVTTNGVLTTLVSFDGTNGANTWAGLLLGSDGAFYGTTAGGGSGFSGPGTGLGTVFKVTTNGILTSLVSFAGDNGASPRAGLLLGTDGNLYGTTADGGINDFGTVFKVTPNGVLTTLVSFSHANGAYPWSGLVLGSEGDLYGTTIEGGSSGGYGAVFRMTTSGGLITLVSFSGDKGGTPQAALLLGNDGNFYGTTRYGAGSGQGTVFKVTTNGVLTSLVSFTGTNGAYPVAGLVLGEDGNFYGTTAYGGSSYGDPNQTGFGTIFKVTTNGVLTTLVSFTGTNGAYPVAGLVLGEDGNFYGTTAYGGSSYGDPNQTGFGTIFKVTTNGVLTTLVSFASGDGGPQTALVSGNDGAFYGTTWRDHENRGWGTVFKVTTNGVFTTLVSFPGASDVYPKAGLVLGSDGNFYGTTTGGRQSTGHGTVFRVTTNGVLTTLVSFTGDNGANPQATLLLGKDGNFYGTTTSAGRSRVEPNQLGYGTVFKVTTNGLLTLLVSFTGDNGAHPRAGLVLGRDGNFYGTTANGGPGGGGTIFRLVISAFTSVARQPGGSVLLTGTGPANGGYRLWASPDLSLPVASWTLLTSAFFDSNGSFSYTDAGTVTNASRFYQLSVP